MIHTDLDAALRELEDALDPDALAQDLLTATGEKALAYDQAHPHDGWEDRTGELHGSFRYEVLPGHTPALIGENTAEHAAYVEAMEGRSVLRSFDSGKVLDMLQQAFDETPVRTI